MTQYLAASAREVTAVEIDQTLIPILKDTLKDFPNVEIINQDILKVDIGALAREKTRDAPSRWWRISPIILPRRSSWGFWKAMCPLRGITVMVQKEVADRMKTGPGSQGLRRPVAGGAVLCEAGDRGQCAPQLFYAPAECGVGGDPSDPAYRAPGKGAG